MNIAPTLAHELLKHGIAYDVVSHSHANSSLHSANAAHIPSAKMVKPVVLEDDYGFVMALVPANQYVKINKLNSLLNRDMGLATEIELCSVFSDCDKGAYPPIGDAYGMYTIVDYDLDDCDDVYIEAGNHTELLHLSKEGFRKLVERSRHGNIGIH
jgi:Ala-tRNA(Pro) deacylase